MWVNSRNPENTRIRQIGFVMAVAASSLGILTLLIPAEINWFSSAYAGIGFAFGLNYSLCLLRKNY
jgi:hypothetical protein